jgi:hypothetical protein
MNLFEETAANEILSRLDKIQPTTQPQWGKMNAAQMMAHCEVPFHVYFGDMRLKRSLMGLLFGKMAKKKLFSGKPWPRNLPTAKQFRMAEQKEFDQEKTKLVNQINRFVKEGYNVTTSTHPFFGKMSSQEWATLAYNHLNHHLEQFGV